MTSISRQTHQPLTAFHVKWLAMLLMTADHVAWRFLEYDTHSSEILHFLGRAVAPLMCYLLVVGVYHTHDMKGYAKRLGLFALISQPPFWLFNIGISDAVLLSQNFIENQGQTDWAVMTRLMRGNVLFSLFLSLIALMIRHHKVFNIWEKAILIALLYPIISLCDYGFAMIYMTLLFDYFYKNQPNYLIIAYLLSLPVIYVLIYGFNTTVGLGYMHFGMILTALIIYGFNGRKGSDFGGRYLFYWFYPVHLLVIAMAEYFLLDYVK